MIEKICEKNLETPVSGELAFVGPICKIDSHTKALLLERRYVYELFEYFCSSNEQICLKSETSSNSLYWNDVCLLVLNRPTNFRHNAVSVIRDLFNEFIGSDAYTRKSIENRIVFVCG